MERELYALWQGVIGVDGCIKGFHTIVYMDHKNNLYSEAQLDNRRRSKKMSNWALELQQYNISRVWIRGEANILADAPSRAPWEAEMARHLPIPDLPLRELIRQMYTSPEAWSKLVHDRSKKLNLDEWQELEMELHPHAPDMGIRQADEKERARETAAGRRPPTPAQNAEGEGDRAVPSTPLNNFRLLNLSRALPALAHEHRCSALNRKDSAGCKTNEPSELRRRDLTGFGNWDRDR